MIGRILIFVFLGVTVISCSNKGTKPVLPFYLNDGKDLHEIWILPDQSRTAFQRMTSFTLKDQNDDLISSDQLRAKALVVTFFFGDCGQRCNPSMAAMDTLQQRFEDQDVLLLSFSIDADKDSLSTVQEWSNKYHADADKWMLLSGDQDQIDDLLSTTFKKNINHPNDLKDINKAYLIDKSGYLRGIYDLTTIVGPENLVLDSRLFR